MDLDFDEFLKGLWGKSISNTQDWVKWVHRIPNKNTFATPVSFWLTFYGLCIIMADLYKKASYTVRYGLLFLIIFGFCRVIFRV